MCGLVGACGLGFIQDDLKMFKDLLYVSGLRGTDSTGIMIANTNRKHDAYAVQKGPVSPDKFIRDRSGKGEIFSELAHPKGNIYMGHTRWATVGALTAENSHPFDIGNLVGMHNGTLRDTKYMGVDKDKGKTDSELMIRDMSKRGILPVLEDISEYSAYAVTIYDKKSRKLYIARNTQRTLFVARNEQAGTLYWASEYEMLYLAAGRNKVKVDVSFFQPFVLYEIDVNNIKTGDKAPWKTTPIVPTKTKTLSHWDQMLEDF